MTNNKKNAHTHTAQLIHAYILLLFYHLQSLSKCEIMREEQTTKHSTLIQNLHSY